MPIDNVSGNFQTPQAQQAQQSQHASGVQRGRAYSQPNMSPVEQKIVSLFSKAAHGLAKLAVETKVANVITFASRNLNGLINKVLDSLQNTVVAPKIEVPREATVPAKPGLDSVDIDGDIEVSVSEEPDVDSVDIDQGDIKVSISEKHGLDFDKMENEIDRLVIGSEPDEKFGNGFEEIIQNKSEAPAEKQEIDFDNLEAELDQLSMGEEVKLQEFENKAVDGFSSLEQGIGHLERGKTKPPFASDDTLPDILKSTARQNYRLETAEMEDRGDASEVELSFRQLNAEYVDYSALNIDERNPRHINYAESLAKSLLSSIDSYQNVTEGKSYNAALDQMKQRLQDDLQWFADLRK